MRFIFLLGLAFLWLDHVDFLSSQSTDPLTPSPHKSLKKKPVLANSAKSAKKVFSIPYHAEKSANGELLFDFF